ncbi:MAG TPA: YihY/virulence factor BrkB family protein [Bryobacteraceae bacterium]|nr:YihY/virulence factor BrkB family protein [Bryobacteraceae bacterium]
MQLPASMMTLVKRAYSQWNLHEVPRLGAALAFYTVLSLAPLLIVVVSIAGIVFGKTHVQTEILTQVTALIGNEGAAAVRAMLENAHRPTSGAIATGIGILTLLFGASGVFGELRSSLDKIWEVTAASSKGGLIGMVRERLFSFGMVLAVGFLLLVSLVISAVIAALGKSFSGLLPLPEIVLHAITFVVTFATISVVFALIFQYVPEKRLPWRDVLAGGVFTSLLFSVGKFLIGLYLGKAGVGSAYGAAGSIVVITVWIYYSAQIFFFGAELTRAYAEAGGAPARAKEGAQEEDRLTSTFAAKPAAQPSSRPQEDFKSAGRHGRLKRIVLAFASLVAIRRLRH